MLIDALNIVLDSSVQAKNKWIQIKPGIKVFLRYANPNKCTKVVMKYNKNMYVMHIDIITIFPEESDGRGIELNYNISEEEFFQLSTVQDCIVSFEEYMLLHEIKQKYIKVNK